MKPTLQKLHALKVAIGVPSTGMWHQEFSQSMVNMLQAMQTHRVGQYKTQEVHTICTKGSILPRSRLTILKQAKKMRADYLLFVDSDQSFPRYALHRLIGHDKEVVGANIATKTMPTLPTARRRSETEDYGELVYTEEGAVGLEKVWRIGCGLLLLSRKVIEALPHDCFEMRYRPEVDNYQGEDWSMCEALEKLGFEIWIDHKVSNEVGHHGTFNFTHEYNGEVQHGESEREEGSGHVLRGLDRRIQAEPIPGPAGQRRKPDQGPNGRREDSGASDGNRALLGAEGTDEREGQERKDGQHLTGVV